MSDRSLKDRLIKQARQNPRKQQTVSSAETTRAKPKIAERFRRFDQHPAYEQLNLMQRGAKRIGITNPFFRVHEGNAGATSRIGDQHCINFSSYNYLGLAGDPRVDQAAVAAIERYGTSVSASRAVSGERPIHSELENAIAAAYAVEDAVCFVSGHATNVSTIGYLLGPQDLVLHDEYIHNSALIGIQLSGARRMAFSHNDPSSAEDYLARHRQEFERVLVVIEGLYSMDGDIPDVAGFIDIKQAYSAWLMVDEAHSFGVLGANGYGVREHCGIDPLDVDIWMGTLSKSLAACGGFIAGSATLVEMLRYLAPGFLYSVGLPPPNAAAALEALRTMQAEPERVERLHAISGYFLQQAKALGIDTGTSVGTAVIPAILGDSARAARLSDLLLQNGVNVQPIVHPAVPEKSARLRFFLSSEHTETQVDETLSLMQTGLKKV